MVPWGFAQHHALESWDKQTDKGGAVLVAYESGPESGPEVDLEEVQGSVKVVSAGRPGREGRFPRPFRDYVSVAPMGEKQSP